MQMNGKLQIRLGVSSRRIVTTVGVSISAAYSVYGRISRCGGVLRKHSGASIKCRIVHAFLQKSLSNSFVTSNNFQDELARNKLSHE